MADQDLFTRALAQNKKWAQKTASESPDLFPTLAKGQSPQILWIGCSDSRVPETTILGLQPGDVFVHRNIANILHPGDLNSLSVIQYAIEHLKVKHVVVCGHASCGGCGAALGNQKLGLIDAWLIPLRTLRAKNAKSWEGLEQKEKVARLVEENVKQGVRTLRENPDVIDAVKERGIVVHGLVYDIATGQVRELECGETKGDEGTRLEAFETSAEEKKQESGQQKKEEGGSESLANRGAEHHHGVGSHASGHAAGHAGVIGGV